MPDFDLDSALSARPEPEDDYSYQWVISLHVAVDRCSRRVLGEICQRMTGIEAAIPGVAADGVRGQVGEVGWDCEVDDGENAHFALNFDVTVSAQHDPMTAVQAADCAETLWNTEVVRRLTPRHRSFLDDAKAIYWRVTDARL